MRNHLLVPGLSVILFLGCTEQSTIVKSPEPLSASYGSLAFHVDKQTAPDEVVEVIVILSRAGFPTILGFANLESPTSATISFDSLAVGQWQISAFAKDSAGTVIYAGETSVTIIEGQLASS